MTEGPSKIVLLSQPQNYDLKSLDQQPDTIHEKVAVHLETNFNTIRNLVSRTFLET